MYSAQNTQPQRHTSTHAVTHTHAQNMHTRLLTNCATESLTTPYRDVAKDFGSTSIGRKRHTAPLPEDRPVTICSARTSGCESAMRFRLVDHKSTSSFFLKYERNMPIFPERRLSNGLTSKDQTPIFARVQATLMYGLEQGK